MNAGVQQFGNGYQKVTESEPEQPGIILRPAGDAGLIVQFGDRLDPAINNAVLAFEKHLRDEAVPGVIETAPTLCSVLVRFDPLVTPPREIRAICRDMAEGRDWLSAPPPEGARLWRIPAVYGGAAGPDLPQVADLLGVSEDQAIEMHTACTLRVMMLGFAPGMAYLGELPPAWDIPRQAEIKPMVPAGSLLVAIRQTVFFATDAPTGWRTIAHSPFRGFRPETDTPFTLSPGDEVAFEPTTSAAAAKWRQDDLQAEAIG